MTRFLNACLMILAWNFASLAEAQSSPIEIQGLITRTSDGSFAVERRGPSPNTTLIRVCVAPTPSMDLDYIIVGMQNAFVRKLPVAVAHTGGCLDSLTVVERGTLQFASPSGSFSIVAAVAAGEAVSPVAIHVCRGSRRPVMNFMARDTILKQAAADPSLILDARVYGDGLRCLHSLSLESK